MKKDDLHQKGVWMDDALLKKIWRMMKLTGLLMLISFIAISAGTYSQNTHFSFKIENGTLHDLFLYMEKNSNLRFAYNKSDLDDTQRVSCKFENESVEQILNKVLDTDKLSISVKNEYVIITNKGNVTGKPFNNTINQPVRTISGKVTDSNGSPLPGVTVVIKGTTQGTITDVNGNYSFSNVPGDATLVFSFVGMETQEIPVSGKTAINVTMQEGTIGIEEVVAIGYGTQKKSDLTGSVVSVNAEKLRNTANTNLSLTLQGTIPGLDVTTSNFAPGSDQTLTIRGESSLSASNDPLIIMDGIPFEGSLNNINTLDIESVSVLKDASSCAIYGARAANGVILITTQKGEMGKTRISYNGSFGIQSIQNNVDMLNPDDYIAFITEYNRWQGRTTNLDPLSLLKANEIPQYEAGITTDWMDLIFRTAFQQEHTISMSGANEKTSYYNSISYLNQEGLLEGDGFKRYSIRSNLQHNLNDWLKIGSNIQLTHNDYGGTSPSIGYAQVMSPYGKLKEDNGTYTLYPNYPETYFINPYANIDATNDDRRRTAIINLFSEIRPSWLPGLSYRLNLGVYMYDRKTGSYSPSTTYTGRQSGGIATISNSDDFRWTLENIVDYKQSFGNHYLSFTGLYSREGSRDESSWMQGKGFVNDDNLYHYMESAEQKDISSDMSETTLESLMGRLNYDFQKKYFLTLTVRRDGYSGFGANNKYGVFPSGALGWVINQENFFSNSPGLQFIDFLKLRLSYGINGNMAIDPYKTLDSFSTIYTIFGDNTETVNGLKNSVIGNPDLKWEGTESYNAGLDFTLFGNRISGTVDLYKSNSRNLLMSRQVPVMNGYTSVWDNVGKTENKGIELTLNTLNIKRGNFSWSSSFNFSLNRDKIVALKENNIQDLANKWFVGKPLRVYYDYKMIGVWQLDDDIANSWQPTAKAGSAKLEDINPDGKITSDDRTIIDSKLPNWRAGLTNELKYKNWMLTIFINTVQGIHQPNDLLNPWHYYIEKNTNYVNIPYWTPDRPSNQYVSPGYDGLYNTLQHQIYQDASFIRIKDVTLSYDCPKQFINKWGINNLKLYLKGNNLYTFTKWIGYDPETTSSSIGAYPSARLISVGVNIEL
ncbi:MAG: TonB-dependent receptor [Mangrovibacterium sp.]